MIWQPRTSMAKAHMVRGQLQPAKGKALGLMIAASAAFWVLLGLLADAIF